NHDVGYSGDMTPERLARFERLFGRANYELRFDLDPSWLSVDPRGLYDDARDPTSDLLARGLRLGGLNDKTLAGPVLDDAAQAATCDFVNAVISTQAAVEFRGHATVVLTHVPLHKPEGVCVDGPFFSFYDDDTPMDNVARGGVREQNPLS